MIDIVIIHKNGSKYRENNLKYALSYYKKNIPDSRIILSELDTETNIEEINKFVDVHIKTKTNVNSFCRALALNEGFKKTTSNYIFFTDNDCIIDESFFINIEEKLKILDEKIIIPYSHSVIDLNEAQTNTIMSTNTKFLELSDLKLRGAVSVGGLFFIKAEFYRNMGGFDPRFIGWGGEDDAFFIKARHFYVIERLNYNVYHLFHEFILDTAQEHYLRNENYRNNVNMLHEYYGFNRDLMIKKINEIGFTHIMSNE
jgi:hypothetical protein